MAEEWRTTQKLEEEIADLQRLLDLEDGGIREFSSDSSAGRDEWIGVILDSIKSKECIDVLQEILVQETENTKPILSPIPDEILTKLTKTSLSNFRFESEASCNITHFTATIEWIRLLISIHVDHLNKRIETVSVNLDEICPPEPKVELRTMIEEIVSVDNLEIPDLFILLRSLTQKITYRSSTVNSLLDHFSENITVNHDQSEPLEVTCHLTISSHAKWFKVDWTIYVDARTLQPEEKFHLSCYPPLDSTPELGSEQALKESFSCLVDCMGIARALHDIASSLSQRLNS